MEDLVLRTPYTLQGCRYILARAAPEWRGMNDRFACLHHGLPSGSLDSTHT